MADRKISDLTALTAPAAGDYLPIVDISEASAANKNKRITIEELLRGAPDGTAAAPSIGFESDPNTGIYRPGADQVAISTGGTARLFVDSSGNVGVSSTAPIAKLDIYKGAGGSYADALILSNDAGSGANQGIAWGSSANISGRIKGLDDGAYGTHLIFESRAGGPSTTTTERVRIDSSGRLLVGTSTPLANAYLAHFNSTLGGGVWAQATGAGDSSYVSLSPGNTVGMHYAGLDSAGTIVYRVNQNGDVRNTNNSYGAISDVKLKENIVDATSQWSDIKALQVRKYNFKEGQTHTQIGLIAQEVELISPGLVSETPDHDAEGNDLGTVTKSVNYSVLYMKAVKALQEAMERIETLEAAVTALQLS